MVYRKTKTKIETNIIMPHCTVSVRVCMCMFVSVCVWAWVYAAAAIRHASARGKLADPRMWHLGDLVLGMSQVPAQPGANTQTQRKTSKKMWLGAAVRVTRKVIYRFILTHTYMHTYTYVCKYIYTYTHLSGESYEKSSSKSLWGSK